MSTHSVPVAFQLGACRRPSHIPDSWESVKKREMEHLTNYSIHKPLQKVLTYPYTLAFSTFDSHGDLRLHRQFYLEVKVWHSQLSFRQLDRSTRHEDIGTHGARRLYRHRHWKQVVEDHFGLQVDLVQCTCHGAPWSILPQNLFNISYCLKFSAETFL